MPMQSYVFPGNIDPKIAAIGAEPFIYMRTDAFSQINKESERMLLDLIHCPGGRTIIYTGSGTGAMSAVVENYVSTKKKAFVIDPSVINCLVFLKNDRIFITVNDRQE